METYEIGHVTLKREDYYHALLWTNYTMAVVLKNQQKKKPKEKVINMESALHDHIIALHKV